jgi:hypothetical protein
MIMTVMPEFHRLVTDLLDRGWARHFVSATQCLLSGRIHYYMPRIMGHVANDAPTHLVNAPWHQG